MEVTWREGRRESDELELVMDNSVFPNPTLCALKLGTHAWQQPDMATGYGFLGNLVFILSKVDKRPAGSAASTG